MNSKEIVIGISIGVLLVLIIFGISWFYVTSQSEFTITKEECRNVILCKSNNNEIDCRDYGEYVKSCEQVEVNNLIACCIEFKDVDYFENYSSHYNVSHTTTVNHIDEKTFCFPEEQNILGFDCNLLEKKDLDTEWLDENGECIEICSEECNVCSEVDKAIYQGQINQGWKCSKYKFGNYQIEVLR